MPFDAVLWSARMGKDPHTRDLQEEVRSIAAAFVLVSDGYDQELARHLENTGGALLARPIHDAALDQVLSRIAPRPATV